MLHSVDANHRALPLYATGNDLRPVTPEYPDYDHLMNHVAVQLDSNDFQLYRTPVVLTLQGEFEDDELNEIIPGQKIGGSKNRGRRGQEEDEYDDEEEEEDYLEGDEDEEDDEEDDEEGEGEEITIDELVVSGAPHCSLM
jgi:hypothetical protein